MNYYLFFILYNFNLYDSFIYNKQIYRSCTNKQIYKMCTNDNKHIFYNFGTNPRLEYPNENGQLTWYPIGFKQEFSKEPKQITIQNNNYIVWKEDTTYYALKNGYPFQNKIFYPYNKLKSCSCNTDSCNTDSCSCNTDSCSCNTDSCSCNTDSCNNKTCSCNTDSCNNKTCSCNTDSCNNKTCSCNTDSCNNKTRNNKNDSQNNIRNILFYKVVEKADMVYLNTIPLTNQDDIKLINESAIYVEPEYLDKNKIAVYLYENIDINYNAKYVTVNNLDLCHTFGNIKIPNPKYNSRIEKIDYCEFHYKITYNYFTVNNIKIENEYLLPHTTISRVYFSSFNSTVISYALPITTSKTKLFVKYYSSYNNSNCIIHFLGDKFIKNIIYTMFKQDILFIGYNNIFSNHYKLNYKKYYL